MASLKENYRQVRSGLGRIKSTLVLAAALPKFLRERITIQQAEEDIKRQVGNRVESFLQLVRTRVYEQPASPYLRLLKHAGCEFSDLRAEIYRHGLEETLGQLAQGGVYLTCDEFKGKKNVVRGQQSFLVRPQDFDHQTSSAGFVTQSTGTSNRPITRLSRLGGMSTDSLLSVFFSAHDLFRHVHAVYDGILPSTGINHPLNYAKLGVRTDRWFATKIPANSWVEETSHYLSTYMVVLTAKWFVPGFPRPEFIDLHDAHRIVRWIANKTHEGKTCCVRTSASNGARIARIAWKMGISLEGAKFIVGDEPVTEAKQEVIKRVGASTIPRYAFSGGGNVGYGCANPIYVDDLHLNSHKLALISHQGSFSDNGSRIRPLLFTTLHPSASRLLLNVENGDYATLMKRDCGCLLQKVGFTQHLHTIRSFEKFTTEGRNYFTADLFGLLESTIPSEFGGGPGDYQLVEEEDDNAQTRLTLLVHPEVGELNEQRLLAALQEGLANASTDRRAARIWRAAGTLRIRRQVPYTSPRGKTLPLHIRH